MTYVFFMGLLLGLRHALDADHIAAVVALATRVRSVGEIVRVGLSWGVGHGLALFAATSVVFIVDFEESGRLAVAFEFLVGAMLMLLGLDVVRRIIRDRVHAHAHRHAGRDIHVHVHSHASASEHGEADHAHEHPTGLRRRAALVGLMHGLAGSAVHCWPKRSRPRQIFSELHKGCRSGHSRDGTQDRTCGCQNQL